MDNPQEAKTELSAANAVSDGALTPAAPPAQQANTEENVLDNLKKENLEMQEEIKKRELLLAKRQELKAREMLGGRGSAGTPVVESPEVQKKKAAMQFWAGTDVARAIERHG